RVNPSLLAILIIAVATVGVEQASISATSAGQISSQVMIESSNGELVRDHRHRKHAILQPVQMRSGTATDVGDNSQTAAANDPKQAVQQNDPAKSGDDDKSNSAGTTAGMFRPSGFGCFCHYV